MKLKLRKINEFNQNFGKLMVLKYIVVNEDNKYYYDYEGYSKTDNTF